MKFKQTAALGLSALMLSGNMALPYAMATTMALSSQPDLAKQAASLGTEPEYVAMAARAEEVVQHPIAAPDEKSENPRYRHRLFAFLANPIDYLFGEGKDKYVQKPAQTASTVPVSKAVPLNPAITINPSMPSVAQAAEPPQAQPEKAPVNAAQPQSTEASPEARPGVSYVQILATPADKQSKVSKNLPKFDKIYPTSPLIDQKQALMAPAAELALSEPSPEETFQMLASSPLDKLAMASKAMLSPSMDRASGSPDISERPAGDTTLLKSGLTQKMTNVDLTIGKAKVIYLNKPASRVSISNPEVANAVVISPNQIQLIGQGVGVANLLIWSNANASEHTVVDISVHRDVSTLIKQLQYVDPGIKIVPMAAEDTIILSGEAQSRESAQLAIEMAKAYFAKDGGAGGANAQNGPSSNAPGSALPGNAPNVINLIKVAGEPSTKIELVRERLQEIDPNIRIDVVPGPEGDEKVILTGRVASASIASKALNMASVFYGQPGIKMITAQGGNEFGRMTVNGTGNSQTATTQSGAAAGGVNMLQGSVMTDATGNVISMLEIAQKPQIKCSIKFLEIGKTALNALGGSLSSHKGTVQFSSLSGAQSPLPGRAISEVADKVKAGGYDGDPGAVWGNIADGLTGRQRGYGQGFGENYLNGVTQVFSINSQIAGALQALQERKKVRTLAEPTLTLLSGEQGSFLAGGELPIAATGGQGQVNIEYKEFGIRLNLLPTVTDDGKIQMQVSPEVSEVDQSQGISNNSLNLPAFVTRRMNTTLIVEPGQSFVLAGLFKQSDSDSVSRFPGLGSLPIIGSFFRNKWNDRRNTEMVVIIKPEILYSTTGNTSRQALKPEPINPHNAHKAQLTEN